MTSIEILLIGFTAFCAVSVSLLLVLFMLNGRRFKRLVVQKNRLSEPELDAIAQKLGVKLGASDEASLDTLSTRMNDIHRKFDWLVSDRMNEQAVDLARQGLSHDRITNMTGVSPAEIEAIQRLRRQ